jgi:AraC-like DNA-binding protein
VAGAWHPRTVSSSHAVTTTPSRGPERAARLFRFEESWPDSPFVHKVWRTRSEPAETFISVADSHWEMVVTRQRGKTSLTVLGPETRASTAPIPEDAEFFGIRFRLGAFIPTLPVGRLVDGSLTLPEATGRSFWLNGSAWEFPGFDDADVFLRRLERQGLLIRDPVVEDALRGHVPDRSRRSVQRRVLRATGLTQGTIRQIERASRAVDLLEGGVPIVDAVALAGYADQAHLTRSLRRFAGQTPGQIGGGTP